MMTTAVAQPQPHSQADLDLAIRQIADTLHRLNAAVSRAVEAGATVEFVRRSRHHDGTGHWGDLMMPKVTLPDGS